MIWYETWCRGAREGGWYGALCTRDEDRQQTRRVMYEAGNNDARIVYMYHGERHGITYEV
jgi:hypothetical protein